MTNEKKQTVNCSYSWMCTLKRTWLIFAESELICAYSKAVMAPECGTGCFINLWSFLLDLLSSMLRRDCWPNPRILQSVWIVWWIVVTSWIVTPTSVSDINTTGQVVWCFLRCVWYCQDGLGDLRSLLLNSQRPTGWRFANNLVVSCVDLPQDWPLFLEFGFQLELGMLEVLVYNPGRVPASVLLIKG